MAATQIAAGLGSAGAILTLIATPAGIVFAQNNQFGGQDRANAASQMIVLAVQQAISSLPPTSAQSYSYELDPKSDAVVRSQQLGPTILRSPTTIGQGHFSVRVAASYFELADTFEPIPYLVELDTPIGGASGGFVKFGVDAEAKVGVFNLAASYGLLKNLEITLNLPIVVVDASASQIFTTRANGLGIPAREAPVSGPLFPAGASGEEIAAARAKLDERLDPACRANPPNGHLANCLVLRKEKYTDLGFSFADGTHVGVGRISVGGKGLVYSDKRLQVGFSPEFFFPSPNEDEFSGSATASFLPRFVAALGASNNLKMYADVGYDCDFDTNELRRFVWDIGISLALQGLTIDWGFGGSKYNEGITWTPDVARFQTPQRIGGTATALGDNQLGTNFVDFLGGIKIALFQNWVLSGAVTVPITSAGLQPDAVGTLAIETYR